MRHAWVTGSSSGIGQAVAQRLLDQGWRVSGLDIAAPTLTHAAFTAHAVDLTDAAAVDATARALLGAGPVRAWVHAAGLMATGPVGELSPADGLRMWQVHAQAATVLANTLLPAMRQAGGGRVVLLGSRVSRGMAGRSQYAATKAALATLARSWAAEVVADGVTVNVISPAATDTPMLRGASRASSSPRLPPLGRLIQPAEVAALASYLLSDDAAAITGQDIAVCGGASLPT